MQKMWAGRTQAATDKVADDFNSSIAVDARMFREDIEGSIAHAQMLAACCILTQEDVDCIVQGLQGILRDLESGALKIDPNAEDIHMYVEQVLTARIGEVGKRLHTARSRNDQVAVDVRLYLRGQSAQIVKKLRMLIAAVCAQAKDNVETIVPGYTHLQRAQPIRFAHQLLAYGMMFSRDIGRLQDAAARMNESPLGACALAGTTYPTDRQMTARALGFDAPMRNSIDAVSDRDFCVEFLSALSVVMMHLSRFCEEIVLWSSWEFRFVELDDAYTTGSSIMPQKKNSDMAELVRGKTGRVYGDLMAMLTMLKGLPLAYNKDMQEDKEAIFDAFDTVNMCLDVFIPMLRTMRVKADAMYQAAQEGFINATDLADYLVRRGMPFRTAYKLVGELVALCIQKGTVLEKLPIETYREKSELFDEDLYAQIDMRACVEKRCSQGGTGRESVLSQIDWLESLANQNEEE
jgi:argininosuccinate lyase